MRLRYLLLLSLGCATTPQFPVETEPDFQDWRVGTYTVAAMCRGCAPMMRYGLPNKVRVSLDKLEWVHCLRDTMLTPVLEEPIIGMKDGTALLVTGEKVRFKEDRMHAVLRYTGQYEVVITGVKDDRKTCVPWW